MVNDFDETQLATYAYLWWIGGFERLVRTEENSVFRHVRHVAHEQPIVQAHDTVLTRRLDERIGDAVVSVVFVDLCML